MKRLTSQDISRIQGLRKAGYPTATIGQLFGVDRSVVAYHTKNLPRMKLVDFLKALLPHTPPDGPPLPKGWSPTWDELGMALQRQQRSNRQKGKGVSDGAVAKAQTE